MRVELGAVPWSRAGDTALKGSIVSRVLLLILHGRGDLLITAHHLHQYTALTACIWVGTKRFELNVRATLLDAQAQYQ